MKEKKKCYLLHSGKIIPENKKTICGCDKYRVIAKIKSWYYKRLIKDNNTISISRIDILTVWDCDLIRKDSKIKKEDKEDKGGSEPTNEEARKSLVNVKEEKGDAKVNNSGAKWQAARRIWEKWNCCRGAAAAACCRIISGNRYRFQHLRTGNDRAVELHDLRLLTSEQS